MTGVRGRMASEIRAELVQRFPDAIVSKGGSKKPLALTLRADLKAVLPHRNKDEIAAFITDYTCGTSYLEATSVAGAARVDLTGFPVGVVTADEAGRALHRLRAQQTAAAERQAERDRRYRAARVQTLSHAGSW